MVKHAGNGKADRQVDGKAEGSVEERKVSYYRLLKHYGVLRFIWWL